jgi:hypothetical protein
LNSTLKTCLSDNTLDGHFLRFRPFWIPQNATLNKILPHDALFQLEDVDQRSSMHGLVHLQLAHLSSDRTRQSIGKWTLMHHCALHEKETKVMA